MVETNENKRKRSATRSLGAAERRSHSQRIAGCIRNAIATMEYPITYNKINVIRQQNRTIDCFLCICRYFWYQFINGALIKKFESHRVHFTKIQKYVLILFHAVVDKIKSKCSSVQCHNVFLTRLLQADKVSSPGNRNKSKRTHSPRQTNTTSVPTTRTENRQSRMYSEVLSPT